MQIGEVIRTYRKIKNMTQEEMANRLGVTAPAVNKWENGNSYPDILLLSPIARLLDISLDTLLSFHEELTMEEIKNILYELEKKLKEDAYEKAFLWAKEQLEKFPNSESLMLQMAAILDAWRMFQSVEDSEKYDDYINHCYVLALESKDEDIRTRAADALFGFYLRKEQYDKAEEYLKYLSRQNPERKRKEAIIFSKTGRRAEAYKAYEELLFSGYNEMSMIFHSIYGLAMEDGDIKKARLLTEKQEALARTFEMGTYHETFALHELAVAEKDVETAIDTAEKILAHMDTLNHFQKSALYEHMTFQEPRKEFVAQLRDNIMKSFREEEAYRFLKEDKRWHELLES